MISCTCNSKAAKKAKTDKTGWDPQPRYKELQEIHFGFLFLFEKTWCDLFFSFLYQEYQVQTCFSWVFFVLITNGMAFSSLEYLARLAANYHRRQPPRKSLRPVNSRCFEKAAWRRLQRSFCPWIFFKLWRREIATYYRFFVMETFASPVF